jgi:hypothetical protein
LFDHKLKTKLTRHLNLNDIDKKMFGTTLIGKGIIFQKAFNFSIYEVLK